MPEVNGFEVLSQLAQTSAPLPVVVISSQDTPGARELALLRGAKAYLNKPVDGDALLDAITTAIGPATETSAPRKE
jgi:DNA-binding NarL/FixJ family response regulator